MSEHSLELNTMLDTANREPFGLRITLENYDAANLLRQKLYRSQNPFLADLVISVKDNELWLIKKKPESSNESDITL